MIDARRTVIARQCVVRIGIANSWSERCPGAPLRARRASSALLPNQATSAANQSRINAKRGRVPPPRDVPAIILKRAQANYFNWYAANKVRKRDKAAAWARANRQRTRAYDATYRARLAQRGLPPARRAAKAAKRLASQVVAACAIATSVAGPQRGKVRSW